MKPNTKARWRPGFHAKVNADVAFDELERIREESGGTLVPQGVVDASREEEAPLHPQFEWNDHLAAEAHRRQEARSMMRSIVVIPSVPEERPRPQYVQVNVESSGESTEPEVRVYVPVVDAMKDPDLRRQVLERALGEQRSWERRYKDYEELAAIFIARQETERQLLEEQKIAS